MNISENKLRKKIREMINEKISLDEADVLLKKGKKDTMVQKKQDWAEEKSKIKENLTNLLKHIKTDNHEDVLAVIEDVIPQLKDWKNKIKKFL